MGINRLPGLAPEDPSVSVTVERRTLLHHPDVVADCLRMLGEGYNGDWDLVMIAIPAGKADSVADALGHHGGLGNGRLPT